MRKYEEKFIRVMPSQTEIDEYMEMNEEDRPIIEIVQDESIVCAYDNQATAWVPKNQRCPRLMPKSKGRGIMVSAYICELAGGILKDGIIDSVEYLEYGQGLWWNSDRMVAQLMRVLDLAKKLYPWARFMFKFDHSSNHKAVAEDALNVKRMNVKSGGAQPVMRDGEWMGVKQVMFTTLNGVKIPKGLQQI